MSIIAGFFLLEPDKTDPEFVDGIEDLIRTHISRRATDARYEYTDGYLYLCRVDLGCYHEASWAEDHTRLTTILGHTFISASLTQDTNHLFSHGVSASSLEKADGTYTALQYDKIERELTVCFDSLSLRPLYYLQINQMVIFSSCQRIFPKLGLNLTVDMNAISEIATIGFPLAGKTRYQDVRSVQAGEQLTINLSGISIKTGFNWGDYQPQLLNEKSALSLFEQTFSSVLNKYRKSDNNMVSTLSGGLDSRVLVEALHQQGTVIECINFSRANSQDDIYASQYAHTRHIRLRQIEVEDTQAVSVEYRLGQYWRRLNFSFYQQVERPRLFWSGNGGSVCLGMVYFSDDIAKACESGSVEAVADAYIDLQQAYILKRLVKRAAELQQQLRKTIIACLTKYANVDLFKAYQLFLWENDQHQHLVSAYEDMDIYRLDFYLPFYAKSLLDVIHRIPPQLLLKHQFYMTWVRTHLPDALCSPWQVYPGHEPCDLADNIIQAPISQWQLKRPWSAKMKLIKTGISAFFDTQNTFYHRHYLGANCILTALGLYNGSATLNVINRMNQALSE
ncbi:hypothetical protein [Photobacterium damselae]|uniref:hypothetical protein n=1 Tax=Photobacterium damselae TaxID=38293 RepID=UPI0009F048FB|nr:hypothetical protein [Photobacterium damselae]GAW46815.1 Asparagine synthetase [glutamine-hydrolyzing] 1 [Photobacterium damselae subsp. piscicida]